MTIREMDAALVAKGWVATSPWWWWVIEKVFAFRMVFSSLVVGVVRGGRRGGKSTTCCKVAVHQTCFVDHHVPEGDVGYFAIISAEKEQAKARLKTIGKMLVALDIKHKETAEEIVLLDRNVGFKVVTASLTGVVSMTCIGALCDEMARWRDKDSGANPARQVMSSLRPSMATMKGTAILWAVSSPWSTLDLHHEMVERGDVDEQLTFKGATWEMNPTLTETDTHALEPDEASWQREYAAVPMSSDETKFFNAAFIDAATKVDLKYVEEPDRVAAGADFAFRRDSSAAVGLAKHNDTFRLLFDEERLPKPGQPLVPSKTITELATIAEDHGCESIACDLHYIETVREHVDDLAIELQEYPSNDNDVWYVNTRVALSQGKMDLSRASPRFIAQLKALMVRPTESGLSFNVKRSEGLAHGDIVSAFVCAMWGLGQEAPGRNFKTGKRRFARGQSEPAELTDYAPED